jgi:3-hydroxybutyryl-CoA dehydratase
MRPRQGTDRWPGPFGVPADALSVGDVWHSPAGRTITESDLVGFAGVSGDFFALHTDEAWAEGTRFGGRIAHGMLVLSVASGLWHLDPDVVVALHGLDRVRFVAPTRIGDTLRVELTVEDVRPRDDHASLVRTEQRIMGPGGPVAVGRVSFITRRQAGGEG